MAKRKKRKSRTTTIRCRNVPVKSVDGIDRIKIGNRFYRTKSGIAEIHPGGKAKACLFGKTYKMPIAGGKFETLRKMPKRR